MLRVAALVLGAAAAIGGIVAWLVTGIALAGIAALLALGAAVLVHARGLPLDGWSAPDSRHAAQNGSGRLSSRQSPPDLPGNPDFRG